MSTRFQGYARYRTSNGEWFDAVPDEWTTPTFGKCVEFARNGCSLPQEDASEDCVPVTRIETISLGTINRDAVGWVRREAVSPRYLLRPGDIQFSNINSLAMIGNCAIFRGGTGGTPLYAGMNLLQVRPLPDRVVPEFLHWQMSSKLFRSSVEASAKPAINQASIPASALAQLRVILPPLSEQTQIARFLDYETARIDALIEKQQRLIELLKEKRQAVISHAVTKGLNPDAPMKDSGVEWLGKVPAHWEVMATSRLSDLTTGNRDTQDADENGEYPFFVRSQTVERIGTYSFDGEGVLTSGDGAGVGKIFHHYEGKFEFHQRVYLFFNFRRIRGRFFFHFFREHLAIVALAGNAKSTVDSLRRPMLRSFPVTVPPVDEQDQIVECLEDVLGKIDRIVARATETIPILQERRTALISAAVTGKIDVRNWKPPADAEASEVA